MSVARRPGVGRCEIAKKGDQKRGSLLESIKCVPLIGKMQSGEYFMCGMDGEGLRGTNNMHCQGRQLSQTPPGRAPETDRGKRAEKNDLGGENCYMK